MSGWFLFLLLFQFDSGQVQIKEKIVTADNESECHQLEAQWKDRFAGTEAKLWSHCEHVEVDAEKPKPMFKKERDS